MCSINPHHAILKKTFGTLFYSLHKSECTTTFVKFLRRFVSLFCSIHWFYGNIIHSTVSIYFNFLDMLLNMQYGSTVLSILLRCLLFIQLLPLQARGLLHHFRTLRKIPCTLEGLCTRCGAGMWDSGHVPTVECARNHPDDMCPYGGKMPPS